MYLFIHLIYIQIDIDILNLRLFIYHRMKIIIKSNNLNDS